MSPAAQTIAEIDQYFDNSLRVRGPNNNSYQRQGTRQFQNSHTRILNNFPCETIFGKPTFVNGSRSPKFNLGYSRPVNFVDLHAQNGWTNMQQQQQHQSMSPIHTNQRRCHQYNVNNQHSPKARKEFAPQNEINRQPFTRMPGNCQTPQLSYPGGKLNTFPRNKLNFNRNNQKLYKHADKSEGIKQSLNKESPGRASDAVSNASDESSGQSENSLPRIIKPRKRRKKDRKPAVEAVETTPLVAAAVTPKIVNPPMNLQTKISVAPDSSSSAINMLTKTSVAPDSSSSAINIPIQKRAISSVSSTPLQQAHKPDTTAKDETVSPFIADSFVNLILDEDKQIANTPTILDKIVVTKQDEEPSSVCQCRYCDPCGEIWDVEQRCYSPFLTPPSPNEPKLFINSIRSVLTGSIAKSNGSSYLLRRSWSEPSESSLMTVRSRNKSDSYEPSSHDLQVSSEIITSPNGHRDIEIKFFSTPKRYSTDLQQHTVPFSNLTPPLSPWKKDVRFGDLFTLPNTNRPTINVSL